MKKWEVTNNATKREIENNLKKRNQTIMQKITKISNNGKKGKHSIMKKIKQTIMNRKRKIDNN